MCDDLPYWSPATPDTDEPYTFDWQSGPRPVLADGETISTSVWVVPAGLTGHDDAATETQTQIRLTGGTVGETYVVHNKVVTSLGRELDKSASLEIRAAV